MPCIMQILSKWTPLFEKSQIIATAMAGIYVNIKNSWDCIFISKFKNFSTCYSHFSYNVRSPSYTYFYRFYHLFHWWFRKKFSFCAFYYYVMFIHFYQFNFQSILNRYKLDLSRPATTHDSIMSGVSTLHLCLKSHALKSINYWFVLFL